MKFYISTHSDRWNTKARIHSGHSALELTWWGSQRDDYDFGPKYRSIRHRYNSAGANVCLNRGCLDVFALHIDSGKMRSRKHWNTEGKTWNRTKTLCTTKKMDGGQLCPLLQSSGLHEAGIGRNIQMHFKFVGGKYPPKPLDATQPTALHNFKKSRG